MTVAEAPIQSSIRGNFTADALLSEPYNKGFELEDGHLVELKVSTESSWIAGEIYRLIANLSRTEHLGWAFPEGTSYQCFPAHLNRVRRPDVSYIRFGRIPGEKLPSGHLAIAPDLAIEVLSPNDLIFRVERKVRQYFEAGVQQLWVVNPDTRRIRVHHPDGSARDYTETQEITAAPVLPTLRFKVADVFPPQPASATVEID